MLASAGPLQQAVGPFQQHFPLAQTRRYATASWHSTVADLNPKSNLNWMVELKIYWIKAIHFLSVQKNWREYCSWLLYISYSAEFSNCSQKLTNLSQCVLSTRNFIFTNFVKIKSVELVLCEHATSSNRLSYGCTQKICIACWYSNQNIDKTASMLR